MGPGVSSGVTSPQPGLRTVRPSPDAPRTEAPPASTRVRSALALLFVAALAGIGLAASVAVGFGVIYLVLRRLVGG